MWNGGEVFKKPRDEGDGWLVYVDVEATECWKGLGQTECQSFGGLRASK